MESPSGNSEPHRVSSGNSNHRRYRVQFSASNFVRAPISSLLEYSGLFRPSPRLSSSTRQESDSLIPVQGGIGVHPPQLDSAPPPTPTNEGEVSIRIIGASEQDHQERVSAPTAPAAQSGEEVSSSCFGEVSLQQVGGSDVSSSTAALDGQEEARVDHGTASGVSRSSSPSNGSSGATEAVDEVGGNNTNRDTTYQRYDIQQAARWIEQVLPFSLLLLVVFIRQHLQDTLVRQAAMVLKCVLLMYYKNGRGRSYRRQGQMLTLVEYLLLLYRALLPTPVWYRFFLNKEYGSLFSSLMTGLYLTFKLTSIVEKVQSFFAAVMALSRKEVHYGAYATAEQVNAAGDMCAICQEKMHAPILLRCKHIFCEDCVSEWFERERTCPLCRALVKPADLKSFGDGSTSLFFQLF